MTRHQLNPSRQLSVQIERSAQQVYDFLAQPENFARWAAGLGSLSRVEGHWVAQTPQGPMTVRFTPRNEFGIVDHYVQAGSGTEIYIPMRVIANGSGSEVLFTLQRQPEMSDENFDGDAQLVMRDLAALKRLLESA